jgi:hypothetical protein
MLIGLGFDDWTTLGGVALAAIAALASWASVALGARARRASLMPELVAQPIQPEGRERTDFLIHNGGGGLARGCGFVFVVGNDYAMGHVSGGFLRPGERAYVATLIPPGPPGGRADGAVICRDWRGNSWVWNLRDDPRKKLRSRRAGKRKGYLSAKEWLAAVHPEIDLSKKTPRHSLSGTDDLSQAIIVPPPEEQG